jgi:hypothetical protein
MDFLHVCLVSAYVFLCLICQLFATIGFRVDFRHRTLLMVFVVQLCFWLWLALSDMAFKMKLCTINNKLNTPEY